MSDSEDDKIDIEYEQFLANRESLLSLARHNIGLFDKSILAMSSGVFGLSILFAERLGGFGIVNAKYLLAYAWIALALSISGQISSYWFAWKDATREIQKQDSSFSKMLVSHPAKLTRFVFERVPFTISTSAFGILNLLEMRPISSVFAAPSIGGDVSFTFSAPACSPTIALLEARGITRTSNTIPPSICVKLINC